MFGKKKAEAEFKVSVRASASCEITATQQMAHSSLGVILSRHGLRLMDDKLYGAAVDSIYFVVDMDLETARWLAGILPRMLDEFDRQRERIAAAEDCVAALKEA